MITCGIRKKCIAPLFCHGFTATIDKHSPPAVTRMKILRKVLSVIFVVLALLSLFAMFVQGFQLLQLASVGAWLVTAAALNSLGGKPLRIIGYLTSGAIVIAFAVFMQITFSLEPGSHDAFGGFVVSAAGILLGLLAGWGIYSAGKEQSL